MYPQPSEIGYVPKDYIRVKESNFWYTFEDGRHYLEKEREKQDCNSRELCQLMEKNRLQDPNLNKALKNVNRYCHQDQAKSYKAPRDPLVDFRNHMQIGTGAQKTRRSLNATHEFHTLLNQLFSDRFRQRYHKSHAWRQALRRSRTNFQRIMSTFGVEAGFCPELEQGVNNGSILIATSAKDFARFKTRFLPGNLSLSTKIAILAQGDSNTSLLFRTIFEPNPYHLPIKYAIPHDARFAHKQVFIDYTNWKESAYVQEMMKGMRQWKKKEGAFNKTSKVQGLIDTLQHTRHGHRQEILCPEYGDACV